MIQIGGRLVPIVGIGEVILWERIESAYAQAKRGSAIPDIRDYDDLPASDRIGQWESDLAASIERRDSDTYPDDWKEIARRVKEEAGWKCIRCGHENDRKSGHVLTVHHLTGEKRDCRWWNIVALCQRCHLRIQGRVDLNRPWPFEHSDWFKPYVAGWYAWKYLGENLEREQVELRLDDLLMLEPLALGLTGPIPVSPDVD